MKHNSTIWALLEALENANVAERIEIESVLMRLGKSDPETLVSVMQFGEGKKCYVAAKILGRIVQKFNDLTEVVVDAMIDALRSPNPGLRQAVAQMLGEIADKRAVIPLLEALSDDNLMVQIWIVESLGKLDDQRAVNPLVDLLLQTQSSTLRHIIVRILGLLGNPNVIPIIETFKDDDDRHVRSRVRDAITMLRRYQD